MFRCFPRTGGDALRPIWQATRPSTHGGNRGIKLSAMSPTATNHQNNFKGGPRLSQEGRQRLEELSAHNIGIYNEQKPVRKLNWNTINVKIGHRHTVQRFDMDYFAGFGRAYTEAVCRRYLAENVRPLWWSAKLVVGQSPVVRNKGSSRLNVAFREALRDAGYDVEGWRVGDPEDGQQSQPWRKKIVQLYGSVEVAAHQVEALSNTKFSGLQAHFAKVVKSLEEELGKTADGSNAAPGQGQPARGTQDRGKSQGGSERGGGGWDRQRSNPPPDRLLPSRKQDARKDERPFGGSSTGESPMPNPGHYGTRRLDIGRPGPRDRPSGSATPRGHLSPLKHHW